VSSLSLTPAPVRWLRRPSGTFLPSCCTSGAACSYRASALAAALVRRLDDPDEADRLGRDGRRQVVELAAWQVVAKQVKPVGSPRDHPAAPAIRALVVIAALNFSGAENVLVTLAAEAPRLGLSLDRRDAGAADARAVGLAAAAAGGRARAAGSANRQ